MPKYSLCFYAKKNGQAVNAGSCEPTEQNDDQEAKKYYRDYAEERFSREYDETQCTIWRGRRLVDTFTIIFKEVKSKKARQ